MRERLVTIIFWLTINCYHEARNQPELGRNLVCKVALNRMADKRWPDTMYGVIWQYKQFSWTLDRKLWPIKDYKSLLICAKSAMGAYLQWMVGQRSGGINHYHRYDVYPNWRGAMTKYDQVGDHIFYVG